MWCRVPALLGAMVIALVMLAVPAPVGAGVFSSDIVGAYITPTAHPDLCMSASSASNGGAIRLRDCGENEDLQQWTITIDDRVQLTSNPSLCLDNSGNKDNNNAPLRLTDSCSSGANNATWPYHLTGDAATGTPEGAFRNTYAEVCLAVKDSDFTSSVLLVRRDCSSTAVDEQFSIGRADMKVAGVAGVSGRPGATVETQLRIENLGPQHAYFNSLAVTADPGLTVNSLQSYHAASTGYGDCVLASATAGSCPAGSTWSVGAMGLVYVNATIPANAAPGTTYDVCGTNTLTPTNDADHSNDTGCAQVTVAFRGSDLAMTDTGTGARTAATTVDPGGTATIPFTLANNGTDAAGIPKATFTAPDAFTVTGITGPSDWTCDLPAKTCTGPTDAFAPTDTAAFTVTGTVASGLTAGGDIGAVTATASVSGDSRDAVRGNDTATNTLAVDGDVTVDVAKTGAPAADPGDDIEYVVTVANGGNSGLVGAEVADTVPGGVTVASWTCAVTGGGSCGAASGNGNDIATTLDIPAGEQAVITIDGTVETAAAGTTLTNTATLTMPSGLANSGGASASVDTVVNALTNLEIASEPIDLTPGTEGAVTATVRNTGPAATVGAVTVTFGFPPGLPVSNLDPRCTDDGNLTATCTLDGLEEGASTEFGYTAAVPADTASGTVFSGSATLSYDLDSDPAGNTIDMLVNTGDAVTDFGITASDASTVTPGLNGAVTFTVTNHGPSTSASDTTVTLRAPTGAAWDTGSLPVGCTASSGTDLTCLIAAGAAPGAATDLGLDYIVDANAASGIATGTARVVSAEDGEATDDAAEWQIDIAAASADLGILKTAPVDAVRPGDQFSYTLTVDNAGPSTAAGVTVADTLPAQLAFVSATGDGATCSLSGQTVTCAYAQLAPGARSITLTVRVDAAYTGTGTDLPNRATVSADTADPDASDNDSGIVTPDVGEAVADLVLSKQTTTDTPIAPGETFTYLIGVANDGPSTATGAVVTDTLPSALGFVASDSGCVGTAGEYGGTVTCAAGTLGAGDEADLLVTVRLDPAYVGTGADAAVTNSAVVSADTADPDSANNDDTVGLPGGTAAAASADVSVLKHKVTAGTVAPGEPVTYTIAVDNDGPSTAVDVDAVDTLPTGMTFASSPHGCTVSGQTVTCPRIVSLAPGSATAFEVVAYVDAGYAGDGADLVNEAAAFSQNTADPDSGNNTDSSQLPLGGLAPASADLSVTKSSAADAGHVSPGETFTYTLTVTNSGPSDAADVAVTDVLPDSVAFVSADDCTGVEGELGGTVSCGPLGALAAASGSNTVDFVVTVRLDPSYSGTGTDVVNAATVASATADPNGANDSTNLAGVPALAAGSADLAVAKTVVGTPEIAPGETFDFSIGTTNLGPSTAVNPTLTDTLGAGMSWESYPSDCVVDGQILTCPPSALGVLQLPVQQTATITTTVKVDPGYTGGELTNTATAASDTADPVPDNDTATTTGGVTVTGPSADIQTTKTLTTTGEVAPGEHLDYRISVHNAGPSNATEVTAEDTLPDGLVFAGAASGSCTGDGQVVTCGPTDLIAPGDTVNHLYQVTVDPGYTGSGADLGNSATAISSTADPDTANNTAAAVLPSIGAPSADLRLTKQRDGSGAVTPGNTFRYALTLRNAGPSAAQNATITDTLPADLAFVSSTQDGCSAAGQIVTCGPLASVPVGSRTIVLTVRLSADYIGDGSEIANTAAVVADTADPNTANNTATAGAGTLSAAAPSADVSLTKAAIGSGPVTPGGQFDYTLTAANAGPSTATGVVVTDTLPAGLGFVASDECTAVGQDLICATIGALAVGAQTVRTVTVQVDPGYTGTGTDLVNTAGATSATADPDSANNAGTATVPAGSVAAPSADVSVTKTALGTDPVTPGQTFAYRLTVRNAGPSTARGVAVTDALPASLAFVSGVGCTSGTGYGATIACATVGELAVGGDAVYTLTVRLHPAYTGTGADLVDLATATAATADPDTANNTSTATVPGGSTAAPQASVSITQTADASATAGGGVAFALTVANTGPSAAQNVTVIDTLPDGLGFASATGASCAANGATVTCGLGTLAPAASAAVTIAVEVDSSVPNGTVLTNVAEVSTSTANGSGDTVASAELTVTAEAGLSLSQSPPAAMTAGAAAVYTFTVQNSGPSDASGVTMADRLDDGLTYASADGASCTVDDANLLTCDFGTVPDGATADLAVTVLVDAATAAGTQFTNTATLATATHNTSTDTSAEATGPPVSVTADLSTTNAAMGSTAVAPGQTFSYRLAAYNNGPSDAVNPVVTDQLPAALAFVSSADGCTGSAGAYGAAVTCRGGATLSAGGEAAFTITVRLHPAFTRTGTGIVNRATVTADTPDPLRANDTATAGLPTGAAAAPIADLSAVMTLDATGPVRPGGTFTYTLTLANQGPSAAAGLTFTDTLPAPLTWVQAVPPANACRRDGQTVNCATNQVIPVGATKTVTVTVALDSAYTGDGSDLVHSGVIASATADPVPANNTTTAAPVNSSAPQADLMLTKGFAAYPGNLVAPGDSIDILLSVNNYGPGDATDAVVTDALPPQVAFEYSDYGCTGEPGVYGGTVTCRVADAIAPHEALAFVVTVRLHPDYVGDGSDILNTGLVSASSSDPAQGNNRATATMAGGTVSTPVAVTEVTIVKSAPDRMVAGEDAVWSVTVANDGLFLATDVTVTDELDPDTTFVSASPAVCSAIGQVVSCDIGGLEADGASTIDLTVAVDEDAAAGDTIANTATVEAGNDPTPDSATAVGPPIQSRADLAVTKTFDPSATGPITPGTTFDYLATVDNLDTADTVEGVILTDAIPAGLDFVEARNAATDEDIDCTETAGTVVCPVADALEPDSSATIALTVELDPSYRGDGQDITNTATVSSDAFDPNDANDTGSVTGLPGGVGEPVYDRVVTTSAETAEPGATTEVVVAVESRGPSTVDESVSITIGMPEHVGAVASELPPACTVTADRDTVTCEIDTDLAPSTETDASGPLESPWLLEAMAIAEAASATWSASILVHIDEDAPEGVELTGGTTVLNTDANDPDGTSDADAWVIRTMAGGDDGSDGDGDGDGDGGNGDGSADGGDIGDDGDTDRGLASTGVGVLAPILTGLGAIVTGLVVTAAATSRRARR
ncbi:ricin-type beta-trefoil lectin domain protein [Glycomyces sp. YM15]|uniref:ricin-type beta-trefoil lectin domain protein n=1 Tax=Glycomyces sp. YM15 TaxID=2800446 RepID=UPI0027DC0815|nr:ricin-type beta-trefoil lectin domain protein [Glycomyces sp. YM15]